MWIYFPFAKSEREVRPVSGDSLDTVRAPLPLLPPIPLPEQPRLLPTPALLDEWLARLPETLYIAGASGFVTGWLKGRHKRSLRWTAENSHRKPDTKAGWYTYRKQKNYAVITAGTLTGLRTGGRYCALTTTFILLEAAAEHVLLLNERWRNSRRRTEGAGAWWGADFWAGADDDDAVRLSGPEVERRNDLRMAGGGALAGGLLMSAGGLYNRFYPPVIRRLTLFAVLAGATHGFTFSYASRLRMRERAAKQALLGLGEDQIDDVGPESVESVREDESDTLRTLRAWSLAAQEEKLADEVGVQGVAGQRQGARGWRAWVPTWGRSQEEQPRP